MNITPDLSSSSGGGLYHEMLRIRNLLKMDRFCSKLVSFGLDKHTSLSKQRLKVTAEFVHYESVMFLWYRPWERENVKTVVKNEYDWIVRSTLFDSLHRITDPNIFKEIDFYTQRQATTISQHVAIPSPNCFIIKHFSFSRYRNISFMT